MSSALSFQWHLCDVFKVTYLISFDTIDYHLHYLHSASLPTVFKQEKKKNKRDFFFLPIAYFAFCCCFSNAWFTWIYSDFHPFCSSSQCAAVLHVVLIIISSPSADYNRFHLYVLFFKIDFFFFLQENLDMRRSQFGWMRGFHPLCVLRSVFLSFFFFFFFFTPRSPNAALQLSK